jgi:amino acid adenylation domain-containing protein
MDHTGLKRGDHASIPQRVQDLSPAKMELLARRLRENQPNDARIQRIPRRGGGEDHAPLSFAQERLWFLDRFEFNRSAMTIYRQRDLTSAFTIAVLDQAIGEMRRRHEVLRTRFVVLDDQPVQVIAANSLIHVPIIDLDGIPSPERAELAARLIYDDRRRLIDLSSEDSLQQKLLLSGHEKLLLEKAHHIAFDARAWQVFAQERTVFQTAFSCGAPSPLPEIEIQYADYSAWQRQSIRGELYDAQMAYWTTQLNGHPTPLELPTDHPQRAGKGYLKQEVAVLDSGPCHSIRELSQGEGCTLFMTLLAGFIALLFRYTGQTDICVGTLISNRNRSEMERLIGFFLNTLVLRVDLSGTPTFRDLARRVRRVTLDAYANSDVPYEKVLETTRPSRSPGVAPMFRIMFGLTDNFQFPVRPVDAKQPVEPSLQPKAQALGPAAPEPEVSYAPEWLDIDLALSVDDLGNAVSVAMEYNSDLFDRPTVVRFLRHFVGLLQSASSDPDQPIRDLPILGEAERHNLLLELNDTAAPVGTGDSLLKFFAAEVRRAPDSVAVVSSDSQVTYREVNDSANRLAKRLRELGMGPETIAAIVSERGVGFLSAMLATFKIGGAYLPLEQSDPPARLRQILAQSLPDVILAQEDVAPNLSQAIEQLRPEDRRPLISITQRLKNGEAAQVCDDSETPGMLAYVIYTSGSTGAPKGAMVEMAGMVNHLCAKVSDLGLTSADVIAQTASQTFDISVWQFLSALISGGRITVVDTEITRDVAQLIQLVERDRVTILEIVPSLLRAMIDECGSAALRPTLSSLRWLLVTGEALPPELCRKWFRLYPGIPLLNAYGPTECSDDVTHFPIYEDPPFETARISVGRPIFNTQLYMCDQSGSLVPAGVPGEALVGGAGIGRGYLGNPERTAEAFIPNPFSSESGARLYRTGDLARYESGGIQFLRRIDHQVKIRGFRIELSEIESVLLKHPGVHEAVVLAREDEPAEKSLTAYVVPRGESMALSPSVLREYIGEHLPVHMIPSAFVLIKQMPLTRNGKIDRKALPAPNQSDVAPGSKFVAPTGTIEEKLAEIWSEVLKLERVGAYDNFFHLGGHSLMATQVIHRINRAFNMNLPVRTIFDEPTIVGLALVIEESLISQLEEESEQTIQEELHI